MSAVYYIRLTSHRGVEILPDEYPTLTSALSVLSLALTEHRQVCPCRDAALSAGGRVLKSRADDGTTFVASVVRAS